MSGGGKSNSSTEDLVTKVFEELSSSGFLEQLRLECVANVKTMSTYLQLKNRFVDLLNKKLSSADWKFEVAAPRLNILREQIVECSVLAVTIERVVDEVVSWKLREQIVPLIKEILCTVYDHKTLGKLKLSNLAKISDGNPSFPQLKEVIKKICNHIHVDWKHVFKDETIGKSLASISVSHISDDGSSSEENDSDSDVEIISDDELKQSGKNKRKIEIIVDEDETRSKRERKKNSKYFSDIYDTPDIKIESVSEKSSTPESAKSLSLNGSILKSQETNNFVSIGVRKSMRIDKNEKSSVKSPKEKKYEKHYPKISEIAIKSEPVLDKVPFSEPVNKTKEELNNDIKNGFVRKSVRQHKPNSRLFWEPGESPQKVRALAAEQEADQDLKQMELTIIENELRHDITRALAKPKSEFLPHGHNTPSKKGTASPKENQRELDIKKKSISPESSSQKYSLAELYKPRPVINGKRGRSRKDGMNKISDYKN